MTHRAVEDSAFLGSVVRHVRLGLNEVARRYARSGRSLEDLGSAEEIATRMMETVPAPSDWDALLGPLYSTSKVARLLGNVSRQAVAERRNRRTLLALRTDDGRYVYPAFQFDAHNDVLSGLAEVLQRFAPEDVDEWTVAGWLVAPQRSLGGRSAIDALASKETRKKVIELAHAQAARFTLRYLESDLG